MSDQSLAVLPPSIEQLEEERDRLNSLLPGIVADPMFNTAVALMADNRVVCMVYRTVDEPEDKLPERYIQIIRITDKAYWLYFHGFYIVQGYKMLFWPHPVPVSMLEQKIRFIWKSFENLQASLKAEQARLANLLLPPDGQPM